MQEYARNAQAVRIFGSQLEASVPWYAHICTRKKAVHNSSSCTAGPQAMADGAHGAQGGSSGSQMKRCCFMGELRLRPQSTAWDPSEMGAYRKGGQGFALLGHAGMHLLCQESEAALTCEKHWEASCLPVSQAQMYFFPCQEFCLWTSCSYLFYKILFSFVSLMVWIYF